MVQSCPALHLTNMNFSETSVVTDLAHKEDKLSLIPGSKASLCAMIAHKTDDSRGVESAHPLGWKVHSSVGKRYNT